MIRALPAPFRLPTLPRLDRWQALSVLGLVLLAIFLGFLGTENDASAYYYADLDALYADSALGVVSYVYPPPLAQALEPVRWLLPFGVFVAVWIMLEMAALSWFLTPLVAAIAVVGWQLNIVEEVWNGNVNLLIGAAILAGFRWPALWAFPILTKLTPGIGLLWFALRREWRSLGIALAASLVGFAVSFALAPHLWVEWWAWTTSAPPAKIVMSPLWVRLIVATGLIVWAALRDAKWVLPIAAVIAMPVPTYLHWTAALAAIPLLRQVVTRPAESASRP